MHQISGAIMPVARVFLLMIAGYLAIRFLPILHKVVAPLLKITLNVLLPIYFIHNLSSGWNEAVQSGWYWMVIFFGASLGMMGVQFLIGKGAVALSRRGQEMSDGKELLLLSALHNAGYVPLPILAVLAPGNLMVYMFFYFLAFNLVFWSVAAIVLSGRNSPGMKASALLNGPLLGIAAGIGLALSGLYRYTPGPFLVSLEFCAGLSLPLLLFLVGAIIALIPKEDLRFRREYKWLILLTMVLYPCAVLLVTVFVPSFARDPKLDFGIRLALVLEAAVPPATNNLIAAKAFGSKEEVRVIGGGIVYTYLVSFVTLPLFITLSLVLFR